MLFSGSCLLFQGQILRPTTADGKALCAGRCHPLFAGNDREATGPQLSRHRSKTQRVWLDLNGATVACLRLENRRWCYEHIPPVGARAEMLRIRNEATGISVGALYHYVDDFDLDGMIDVGSTTRIEPPERAPVANVIQFFHRATNRAESFRTEYQKMYDEGIQIALKYLGE